MREELEQKLNKQAEIPTVASVSQQELEAPKSNKSIVTPQNIPIQGGNTAKIEALESARVSLGLHSVDRIVGATAQKEVEIDTTLAKRFSSEHDEDVEVAARFELSPIQKEAIRLINIETNDLLARYNIEPFNISEKQITIVSKHILDEEEIGHFVLVDQKIRIDRNLKNTDEFFETLFHEMLHMKAFQSVNSKMDSRRVGLTAYDFEGNVSFLDGLDEAITEELAMRCLRNSKIPQIVDSLQNTQRIKQKYARSKVVAVREMLDDPDLMSITEERLSLYRKLTYSMLFYKKISIDPHIDKNTFLKPTWYSYSNERKGFNILIDTLFKENASLFSDREQIFDCFAQAYFSGRLLEVSRLLKNTFRQNDILRQIGERISKPEELESFLSQVLANKKL